VSTLLTQIHDVYINKGDSLVKIEVLMSTMNKNYDTLFREVKTRKIKSDILIINQSNNQKRYFNSNIRIYNYNEKGLSKSRNRGLENANGEICVIADDDIIYKESYCDILKKSFEKNLDADIITFQIETPDGNLFKNYSKKEFWHNKRTILKVSSIEIAFRRDSIIKNNIKFDERFGLGSKYITGEENIFLMDCLDKGLKIKYIPSPIVIHPYENSGRIFSESLIFSKGAVFARLFKFNFIVLNFLFALKKYKEYKNCHNFINFIRLIYKGSFDFISNEKMSRF